MVSFAHGNHGSITGSLLAGSSAKTVETALMEMDTKM